MRAGDITASPPMEAHAVLALEPSEFMVLSKGPRHGKDYEGRFTPGGHIPILPDSALATHKPDYALLLAWNFSKEIMANLKDFRKQGGKFIIPIPKPKIIR